MINLGKLSPNGRNVLLEKLSKQFGVSKTTISNIKNKKILGVAN